MLRLIKIILIATIAAWGYVGAFGNMLDWSGTYGAVLATATMSTWEGGAESWRATSNPALVFVAAALIPLLKLLFAGLCTTGAWSMWCARANAAAFERAKSIGLAGCGVAIFLLFAGWIVVAETWFELWRSPTMGAVSGETAWRYLGSVGLIGLFVALRDEPDSA